MEFEDRVTRERLLEESSDAVVEDEDDVNGWIDERAALSQAEREVLQTATRPVKMVLVKVSSNQCIEDNCQVLIID